MFKYILKFTENHHITRENNYNRVKKCARKINAYNIFYQYIII